MVERPCRAELLLLLVLALAPSAALAQAQEPTVVRLRDAVGDTIDAAERDTFRLFPSTAGFQHAVILALPGPEYYADVTLAAGDTSRQVYFRILPNQLERIRFLVDNRQSVAEQTKRDTGAAFVLAAFWQDIEGHPLPSFGTGQAAAQGTTKATDNEWTGSQQEVQLSTLENRYNYTLHGTTLGSLAGGAIGSLTSIEKVGVKVESVYVENCNWSGDVSGGGSWYYMHHPIYSVNQPLFWTAACGITALGSTGGYLLGSWLDRKQSREVAPELLNEGTGCRTCCGIGAAVPGIVLGILFATGVGGSHYGKTDPDGIVENDESGWTRLPMVLTGACFAVELTTIGYQIGRAIDRDNAARAEAKRRALGR